MIEADIGFAQNCQHHWIIDSPCEGERYSPGKCVQESCGETRLFDNYPGNDLIRERRLETFPVNQAQQLVLAEFVAKLKITEVNT